MMTSVDTVPKPLAGTRALSSAVEFREIPLTRGYIARVSPEDYDRVAGFPWFALMSGRNVYAAYKPSYSKKTYLLHRMVLDAPDGSYVDHRPPRETLDCTRSNLRLCTPAQNAWNSIQPVGKLGFIGVRRSYVGKHVGLRFVGAVRANGRVHYTKTFPSPVLAAAARDLLAQQLHGDFAVLNFQFTSFAEVSQ